MEQKFRSWYEGWATKAGITMNPDNKFKLDEHPNRFNGIDTRTGAPGSAPMPPEGPPRVRGD